MISKIQGFNHLKGGLNKRWSIKKDISYAYQCDVMQKIGYTINDLNDLLDNIDKIHTTEMGVDRIKRNLKIDTADVVEYCKNKVLDKNCNIYKQGKNWYCEVENIKITINSYSYTIITAHIVK